MRSRIKSKDRIVIVGGYHKAKSLAISLIEKGYEVTAINKNFDDCNKLAEVRNLNVIYGDGSKNFILEEANVCGCNVAIALTDSDESNLVVCQLCKKLFNVKKTVALLNDPNKTDFFYAMGVDRVVCAINMITNIMEEQALMDEMTRMIPIDEGKIQIVEMMIPKSVAVTGKRLFELNMPKDAIIGCVIRGDESLIPRGDTRIMEGDILIIITSDKGKIQEIKELMIGNA